MTDIIPAVCDGLHGEIVALLEIRHHAASRNVAQMRAFYPASPALPIVQRPPAQSLASQKVLAAEYQMVLPDEKLLADELDKTRRELDARRLGSAGDAGDVE